MRAIMALILREMATRYGRSPGGYVWAVLEPVGFILVMSIAFSLILDAPPIGNNFPLFFATGFLPFSMFTNLANLVGRSINFSRALLFYPAVSWVDAAAARAILNTLTDILVMVIIFVAIVIATDTRSFFDLQIMALGVGLTALLGLGIGVLNCALFGLFKVWMQIWSIITRPLFLASGVFFLYDDLPQAAQDILWFNPLMHIVGVMRSGFYPSYSGEYISILYVVGIALVSLFFGLLLLGRFHRHILQEA